jgi:hypothetical protein
MKESRKLFIKSAHGSACQEWKDRIEEEFPKLFEGRCLGETDLIEGRWYKKKDYLMLWNKSKTTYGFYKGGWGKWCCMGVDMTLATSEEVGAALIKEGRKRGLDEAGIKFRLIEGTVGKVNNSGITKDHVLVHRKNENRLMLDSGNGAFTVYSNGKWAKPLKTITKSEAEKELGKLIKD